MKIIKLWFYFSLLSIFLWAFFDIRFWKVDPDSSRIFAIYLFHFLGVASGVVLIIENHAKSMIADSAPYSIKKDSA